MRERSRSSLRAAVATLGAALLLPAPAQAWPEVPRPVAAGVDLVIMRPLGLAAAVVGAVLFLPVALVSAPQGRDGIEEAWELLVSEPAKDVYQRPLGDF